MRTFYSKYDTQAEHLSQSGGGSTEPFEPLLDPHLQSMLSVSQHHHKMYCMMCALSQDLERPAHLHCLITWVPRTNASSDRQQRFGLDCEYAQVDLCLR